MKEIRTRLFSLGLLALVLVVLLGVCAPAQVAQAGSLDNEIAYRPSGYDKDYIIEKYLADAGVTADDITIIKDGGAVEKLTEAGEYTVMQAENMTPLCDPIVVKAAKLNVTVTNDTFAYTGAIIDDEAMGLRVLCGDSGEDAEADAYTVEKSGDLTEPDTYTITAQPTDGNLNYTISDSVTITITKRQVAYPAIAQINVTYQPDMQLADVSLDGSYDAANGTYAWADPTAVVGDAGEHPFDVNYTQLDAAHDEMVGDKPQAQVLVAKAVVDPATISWPVLADTYDYKLDGKLSDVDLTAFNTSIGTFTWENPNEKPVVNQNEYNVVFTLNDSTNYAFADGSSSIVGKTNLTVNKHIYDATQNLPTASALTYGQIMSASALTPAGNDYVTFAWENPNDQPTAGTTTANVVLTLIDSDNVELSGDAVQSVPLTVNRAVVDSLTLGSNTSAYNAEAVNPQTLKNSAEVKAGELVLTQELFDLTCAHTMLDADTYAIEVVLLDTANFDLVNSVTAEYTITPATVTSATLLGNTGRLYDGSETLVTDLTAEVKAGELTLPSDAYELACDEQIVDAGEYAIKVQLTAAGTVNYALPAEGVAATYKVSGIPIDSLTLDVISSVYTQTAVDLTMLSPHVSANGMELNASDFELYCVNEVKDAGDYAIRVRLTGDSVRNYEAPETLSATYTIFPATVDSLTLGAGKTESVYNQSAVDLTALEPIVMAGTLTVPADAYQLTCDVEVKNVGTYDITVQPNSNNYTVSEAAKATYSITQATLEALTLGVTSSAYNAAPVDLTALNPTLTATGCPNPVPTTDYTLVCDTDVLGKGEYTLRAQLNNSEDALNYTSSTVLSAIYSVTKCTVDSLTLGVTELVYNQQPVALDALNPVVKAGETVVQRDEYELFLIDATEAKNVGVYTIGINLPDTDNYDIVADASTVTFAITPATLSGLTLGETGKMFDGNETTLDALMNNANTVLMAENGALTVPKDAYTLSCDGQEPLRNAGVYVIRAALTDTLNYASAGNETAAYTVTRRRVDPIQQSANVLSEGTYVLGGPESAGNRTILITAFPNVELALSGVIDGTITTDGNGHATVIVKGEGSEGQLTVGNLTPVTVRSGQMFELNVAYADTENLTDNDSATAPTASAQAYVYDMEALPVTVEQLYNRAAGGVVVNLPEDLKEIAFASAEGTGVPFNGASADLKAGDGQMIPFSTTNKLHSTVFDPQSVYTVTYTDLVGNVGTVTNLTVAQASGTLRIDALQPDLNASKRIGATGSLTWTITCQPTGGNSENVVLNIGGAGFGGTLTPGANTMTTNTGSLRTDSLLNVVISFEDLIGSATFESFVYDPKCDAPVLTSEAYADCFLLSGIVEPGASVQIRVNDIVTRAKVDSFGVFVAQMPVMYEGDEMIITVTDQAGNTVVKNYMVSEERLLSRMTAYMMGKTFTNAHEAKADEEAEWTTITTVTENEIREGKAVLPIVAGNLVQVGTITMTMDENGGISYSYTLEDGVELLSEDVRVYTSRSKEEAIAHTGVLLSTESGTKLSAKRGTYYVTAEFEVDVPVDMLQTTFQTEKVTESELKRCYRDRQSGKPLQ